MRGINLDYSGRNKMNNSPHGNDFEKLLKKALEKSDESLPEDSKTPQERFKEAKEKTRKRIVLAFILWMILLIIALNFDEIMRNLLGI